MESAGSQSPHSTPYLLGLSKETLQTLDNQSALGDAYAVVRKRAFSRFAELPFPTSRDELWRQTKPEQFPFEHIVSVRPARLDMLDFGKHDPVHGDEVSFSPGFAGEEPLLRELFEERAEDIAENPIAHLHLALAGCGGVVRVRANRQIEAPLLLSQALPSGATASPLVVIELEAGASASFVEDLGLAGSSFYLPRIEVVLRDNASCSFLSLQRSSNEVAYLGRHRLHLGRDSRIRTLHVVLGAHVSRLDLDCMLYEPGASAQLDALYLISGNQHVDFHPRQEHIAPHCNSNLYYKGALRGSSRGVYYGLISVGENAQKTDAYQKNRNLLLSPDARADAIPNLEIRASDVKCSHGVSVGQVGAEELFYLMARGLPRPDAERILVEGFFEDLLAREPDLGIRSYVRKYVLERLNAGI